MPDSQAESDSPTHTDSSTTDTRSAWERALDGPPINPRAELIYHDRKRLRSRHAH